MGAAVTVGVVANPASGRDIRRLVSGASVFDNAEKGSMVYRLLAGLGAAGVERVLLMPAPDGVGSALDRQLRARTAIAGRTPMPRVELLDTGVTRTARDTERAVRAMVREGVAGIAVLGGDGTHRIVAKDCAATPLCALSTGTNNVFPEMREATVAGLALGLVATGQVALDRACRQELALAVGVNGDPALDLALVDVAVTAERYVGARALWHADGISELFATFARPSAIGLSAVAGLLDPVGREDPHGVHLRLGPAADAPTVVTAPIAPGLVAPIGVLECRRLEPGEIARVRPGEGSIALDGERELERVATDRITLRLVDGPRTIDVDATLRQAADSGLLRGLDAGARAE